MKDVKTVNGFKCLLDLCTNNPERYPLKTCVILNNKLIFVERLHNKE